MLESLDVVTFAISLFAHTFHMSKPFQYFDITILCHGYGWYEGKLLPFVELGPQKLGGRLYGYFLLQQQISNPYFWEKLERGVRVKLRSWMFHESIFKVTLKKIWIVKLFFETQSISFNFVFFFELILELIQNGDCFKWKLLI